MRAPALLLVAAALLPACTDFENPTTVIDLRMLAVRVEPSEIILDANLDDPSMPIVDPANNPPVMVKPLIVDPLGNGRELAYTITACPNNPFASAPQGGGQGGGAFPSGGARTTVGSALCAENSPTTWPMASGTVAPGATIALQPETMVHPSIDQLIAAFMADVFPDQFGNIHGGFDLGMPLTLDITIDAGTEQIRGIKRILYWGQRINDVQLANQTPAMDKLELFYTRDEATFMPADPPVELPSAPQAPLKIAPGTKTVWIMPSPGVAESFQTTVIDPDTHRAVPFTVERETLRYRFFTTAGTFAPASTMSELPPVFDVKMPIRLESQLTLPLIEDVVPNVDGKPVITIWVVVRDDRGAEFWQERQLELTP